LSLLNELYPNKHRQEAGVNKH